MLSSICLHLAIAYFLQQFCQYLLSAPFTLYRLWGLKVDFNSLKNGKDSLHAGLRSYKNIASQSITAQEASTRMLIPLPITHAGSVAEIHILQSK